jgi:antitoxin component YwqK of YwqJK toxin-antitoxin module
MSQDAIASLFRPWIFCAALVLLGAGAWAQPATPRPQPARPPRAAIQKPAWPPGTAGVDYNVVDAAGKRQGVWIRVWPDGTLYYKGAFENGYPVGTFEFYYESGALMSRIDHTDQGRRMAAKHFRENGKLRAEGLYVQSAKRDEAGEPIRDKDGLWRYYDEAEKLRMEESYAGGVLEGPTRTLTPAGRVIEEGAYAQGERHGVWKTYTELGVLLSEIGYERGLFHGRCNTNYPDGKPLSVGTYERGEEIGFWKTFTADGLVECTRRFDRGTLVSEVRENGSFMDYYEDERPRSEFNFKAGKMHGPFREWHDVGTWALEEVTDPQSGEKYFRRVMEGVQVAREGTYVDGALHGAVKHYDTAGRLLRTEHYENGTLVRTETR